MNLEPSARHRQRGSVLKKFALPRQSSLLIQSQYQEFARETIICSCLFQSTLVMATFFVLFGDSFRTMVTDSSAWETADQLFFSGFVISFFLFSFEFALQCYAMPDYLKVYDQTFKENYSVWENLKGFKLPKGSFFFWVDLVAILSLVFFELLKFMITSDDGDYISSQHTRLLDMGFIDITQSSVPQKDNFLEHIGFSPLDLFGILCIDSLYLTLRISRFIRLFRTVKLFRIYQKKRTLGNYGCCDDPFGIGTKVIPGEHQGKEDTEVYQAHSFIGKSMGETTLKRATLGVLVILLVLPVLEYPAVDSSCLMSSQFAHIFFCKSQLCDQAHRQQSNVTTSWDETWNRETCAHIDHGFDTLKKPTSRNHCGESLIYVQYSYKSKSENMSKCENSTCFVENIITVEGNQFQFFVVHFIVIFTFIHPPQ
jgi:hypothetical protein